MEIISDIHYLSEVSTSMRRVMQKVHALKKYNQRDIERIAKVIRLSVEQV